jgi:hypothetical protein
MHDGDATVDLLRRGLGEYGLEACARWAVEHVSTIFDRLHQAGIGETPRQW